MIKHNTFLLLVFIFWFPGLQAQTNIDQFDFKLLQKLEAGRTPSETKVMRTISDANNYVNAAIPLGLLLAGAINHDKDMQQNALYIATSSASTALINWSLKKIFKRPRPFIVHITLTPAAKHPPTDYSLPSGHTSLSFSTASALSIAYPKWYVVAPSFLWAGTVGYARMYLGVHNPSDVLAGAALGIGTAWGLKDMSR